MKTPILGLFCLLLAPVLVAQVASPQPEAKKFKIIQPGPASQYPIRMLNQGVTSGSVRALLHVDGQGKLVDTLIVAYSHRDFADEALRTIEKWQFQPELTSEGPVATIADITFNYEVNGIVFVQRFGMDRLELDDRSNFAFHATTLKNLDQSPRAVSVAQPVYPTEWINQGITGRVTVEFYIDETGHVRMPTVSSSPHDWLAAVAIDAVQKWQFAPPTSKGKPVLVRAQQVFTFNKDQLAAK